MEAIRIFKKDYIISLEIGTSSIKVAEFAKKEESLTLLRASINDIKHPLGQEPSKQDILLSLKDILKSYDIKKSDFVLAINCPITTAKNITAPYMPKNEIKNGILMEAKSYFSLPIDKAFMDFEITGDNVEKGIRRYDITLAISPKETVNKYLSILEGVGIKPSSFVPYSYALQNFSENLYSGDNKTRCTINIGEKFTELIIMKSGRLKFTRKIPVSGDSFTKALTSVLASERGKVELSIEEAERIKCAVGIPNEGDQQIIENKISTSEINSLLSMPLDSMAGEIERCFDYYREETNGEVDSVVLYGGGAFLKGINHFLAKRLGVEVSIGDAFEKIIISPKCKIDRPKVAHRFAIAIGAALSRSKGINVLPAEIKEETTMIAKRATIQSIAAILILTLIFLYVGMKIQISNLHKRIDVAKLEINSLEPMLQKAKMYSKSMLFLADEPHWEDALKEFASLIPDGVHITRVKKDDKLVVIDGVVASEDGEGELNDFVTALEKGIFEKVQITSTKDLRDGKSMEFQLRCENE